MKLTLPLAFAAVTVGGVTAKTGNGPGAGVAVGLGVRVGIGVGVGVGVAPLRPAWVIAITLGLPLALLAVMVICAER